MRHPVDILIEAAANLSEVAERARSVAIDLDRGLSPTAVAGNQHRLDATRREVAQAIAELLLRIAEAGSSFDVATSAYTDMIDVLNDAFDDATGKAWVRTQTLAEDREAA